MSLQDLPKGFPISEEDWKQTPLAVRALILQQQELITTTDQARGRTGSEAWAEFAELEPPSLLGPSISEREERIEGNGQARSQKGPQRAPTVAFDTHRSRAGTAQAMRVRMSGI